MSFSQDLAESHVSAGIAHCMVQDYEKADSEFENVRDHLRFADILAAFPD